MDFSIFLILLGMPLGFMLLALREPAAGYENYKMIFCVLAAVLFFTAAMLFVSMESVSFQWQEQDKGKIKVQCERVQIVERFNLTSLLNNKIREGHEPYETLTYCNGPSGNIIKHTRDGAHERGQNERILTVFSQPATNETTTIGATTVTRSNAEGIVIQRSSQAESTITKSTPNYIELEYDFNSLDPFAQVLNTEVGTDYNVTSKPRHANTAWIVQEGTAEDTGFLLAMIYLGLGLVMILFTIDEVMRRLIRS